MLVILDFNYLIKKRENYQKNTSNKIINYILTPAKIKKYKKQHLCLSSNMNQHHINPISVTLADFIPNRFLLIDPNRPPYSIRLTNGSDFRF
jgi:hypothetical protein